MKSAKKVVLAGGVAAVLGIGVLVMHNQSDRVATEKGTSPRSVREIRPWEKMVMVATNDPDIQMAQREAMEATLNADREQRLKKAREEKLRLMSIWQGTEFPQTGGWGDDKGKPREKPLSSIFEAAIPESREVDFAWCSEDGFKLVGWMVVVLDQAEFNDGWNVLIEVRPRLMHIDHAVPYSFQVSTETWWIPKDGVAKLVRSHPGEQTGPNTVVFD